MTVDLYADEYGKAIHEDCYVKRVSSRNDPSAIIAADGLRTDGSIRT